MSREDWEKRVPGYKMMSPSELKKAGLFIEEKWKKSKAKRSSTGPSNAPNFINRTLQVNAGDASARHWIPPASLGLPSGTAGSVTLFGAIDLPLWVVINGATFLSAKAHLKEDESFALLCGKEKPTTNWRSSVMRSYRGAVSGPAPRPDEQCKICVAKFEKNVLGGKYER